MSVVMVGGRVARLTLMKMTTPLAGVAMVMISLFGADMGRLRWVGHSSESNWID